MSEKKQGESAANWGSILAYGLLQPVSRKRAAHKKRPALPFHNAELHLRVAQAEWKRGNRRLARIRIDMVLRHVQHMLSVMSDEEDGSPEK